MFKRNESEVSSVSASIETNSSVKKARKAKKAEVNEVKVPEFKFSAPIDDLDKVIQKFLTGKEKGVSGNYRIDGDRLIWRTSRKEDIRFYFYSGETSDNSKTISNAEHFIGLVESGSIEDLKKAMKGKGSDSVYFKYHATKEDVIAVRLKRPTEVYYVGNSSILPLIGARMAYGNEQRNRSETDVQRRLSRLIPMFPFVALIQADLDLTKLNVLERGSEGKVSRKRTEYNYRTGKQETRIETVHFTGASLIEVEGVHFLFDIDRREVEHKIFNPFMVQLKGKPKTIATAYESLKPDEVKKAEAKGIKVLRQGEWFFIPTSKKLKPITQEERISEWKPGIKPKRVNVPGTLRAGQNRPNRTEMFAFHGKEIYVKGLVEHSGREHEPILLKQWCRAIPNTSVRSFTITGDID
jgi:hypothetical protein